jgi:hypothetical protein
VATHNDRLFFTRHTLSRAPALQMPMCWRHQPSRAALPRAHVEWRGASRDPPHPPGLPSHRASSAPRLVVDKDAETPSSEVTTATRRLTAGDFPRRCEISGPIGQRWASAGIIRCSDQVGRFVAFRFSMFHAAVHTAKWPLHIPTGTSRAVAIMRLVAGRVREAICGLRGHDMVLHFEPQRLSLRCLGCGVHTQGWTIDVKPIYRIRRQHRSS